jgi:hypothetical protein
MTGWKISKIRFLTLTAVMLRIHAFREVTLCSWLSGTDVSKQRAAFKCKDKDTGLLALGD